ncbi:hypothetical protein K2173_026807 [Erythroxylum novogranatense]|uniref:Uncharacterized protein n=1 Tax=Erythroxylum novogranatense TaxID=1862640 RepID=A0AAV8U0M5_9ROSI|nr:hypothetical protein K2173_026807 [Erythroxylum novogranatense]
MTKYGLFCLVIFRGFDLKYFGLDENDVKIQDSMKQLLKHVSTTPLRLLNRNPRCEFLRFCEYKYQELVLLSIESSIFCNLDPNEVMLSLWRFFIEKRVDFSMVIWKCTLLVKIKLKVGFIVILEFKLERIRENVGSIQSQVYLSGLKCRKKEQTS